MVQITDSWFDLAKIADSGQCFRIVPCSEGQFVALSKDRFVYARLSSGGFWELDCSQEEFDSFWRIYFDLDRDYESWIDSIDPKDEYLLASAKAGWGLRVLNQDPWEALVSFIISQRRSVSSITSCVEKLCRYFGDEIGNARGARDAQCELFSFPRPERLAGLCKDDLRNCSMGYRDDYVLGAARMVVSGELDLDAAVKMEDQELLEELMKIRGVGIKVANCTALYGFHRLGLVPVDVWIARVLEKHYPLGFPVDRYPGYAGFLQLLMFYEARHPLPRGFTTTDI